MGRRRALLAFAIAPTAVVSFGLTSSYTRASSAAFQHGCHQSASRVIEARSRRRIGIVENALGRTPSTPRQSRRRQRIPRSLLPWQASRDSAEEESSDAARQAREKAEAALRQLTPEELQGLTMRLSLDNDLEGREEIIARAAPILAYKILAKQTAQSFRLNAQAVPDDGPRSAPNAAPDDKNRRGADGLGVDFHGDGNNASPPESNKSNSPYKRRIGDNHEPASDVPGGNSARSGAAGEARLARSRKAGSKGEWVTMGGDGEERGWVGEKGSRRWVGPPGEKPPRQRHTDRESEVPLAPGQRAYFATCPRGLETVLRDELMSPAIGAAMVKSSGMGCHFRGDQSVGYRAILWSRTAHRVLELVGESAAFPGQHPIVDAESLYEVAAAVPWSRYMSPDQTLSVDAILGVVPDGLTHSHFTALTVKNAVVDQFRESGQQRPSVNTEHPDLPLVVYLDRGRALLYRSLSGTRSMHKRGYRNAMHAASLKENVAAGLLLASGWDSETQSLADPMCGSGTLVIEAALIAMRRAPGLVAMGAFSGTSGTDVIRKGGGWGAGSGEGNWKPAVFSWPDFDDVLWNEVVDEAMATALPTPPEAIMGNDWHHGALSLAWRDAKAAGVVHCITLHDEDVARWRPPTAVGLAVTNPPWDQRLDREAEGSWHGLLEFLRREVAERDAWVLSGNPALSRVLRMKSEENIFLATGGVELRWLKYHLNEYRGDGRKGKGRGPRPKKVSRANDRPAIDRW